MNMAIKNQSQKTPRSIPNFEYRTNYEEWKVTEITEKC